MHTHEHRRSRRARTPQARPLSTLLLLAAITSATPARAAGTLVPVSSGDEPMRIAEHHLEVRIDNGFARTEVTQSFDNPNPHPSEAVYWMPLPLGAALGEMTIESGDQTLYGEVVPHAQALAIYEQQRSEGNQAGLATKEGYQRFEFRVAAIPAGERATIRFAYYQALKIDNGVGRYLYPLEDGGTDTEAEAFWTGNQVADGGFSANITLQSAWPIEDVRLPELGSSATITQDGPGDVRAEIATTQSFDRDLVFYYRLADDLPGRVEVIPYRDDSEQPGTFMMVLTPGIDLQPLGAGRDHLLLIDVSGSMDGKLESVKTAAIESLGSFEVGDRYRIFTFSDATKEITSGWMAADGEGDVAATSMLEAIHTEGGTNFYQGLEVALAVSEADRATALYVLTDAVANEGVLDPQSFAKLAREKDVRIFGMLMGNSGNWPLMELVTEVSGGFYAQVSNSDDIFGQVLLAREKTRHEAIHDFEVLFDGGEITELTHSATKVHRGQQVVLFGRYGAPGKAGFTIEATITGQRRSYEGSFELPTRDTLNSELERLWAFEGVRWLEYQSAVGLIDAAEASAKIEHLGLTYQLVTDETTMVLLSEDAFAELGIDPENRERTEREAEARELRDATGAVDYSAVVDASFTGSDPNTAASAGSAPTPSSSGASGSAGFDDDGGAAVSGPETAAVLLLALAALTRRRRRPATP